MNFNKLANILIENNDPSIANDAAAISAEGARGRTPNPEIAKLIAQGMPYWKARAMVNKGSPGPTASSLGDTDSPTGRSVNSASAQKTQVAVDDFIYGRPEATPEEVITHLKGLNSGPLTLKTGYVTSPEEVMGMIKIAKGSGDTEGSGGDDVDFKPDSKELAKQKAYAKIAAAMSRLGMKTGNAEEVLGKLSRDKLKLKVKPPKEDDEEESEVEIDPSVSHYVSAMRRKRDDNNDDAPDYNEQD
jgi:hypothetical protein